MKKIAAVLLAAALMTAAAVPAFAANTTAATTSASVSDSEYRYMPVNSFADYDRQSDAETKSGVTVTLPDAIAGYKTDVYRASESLSMIEVIYARTSGTDQIRVRKAVGNDDISGDYNIYSETSSEAINSHAVTFKGNNGKVNLATWTADGFIYAISSDEGLTLAQMSNLVRAVK